MPGGCQPIRSLLLTPPSFPRNSTQAGAIHESLEWQSSLQLVSKNTRAFEVLCEGNDFLVQVQVKVIGKKFLADLTSYLHNAEANFGDERVHCELPEANAERGCQNKEANFVTHKSGNKSCDC